MKGIRSGKLMGTVNRGFTVSKFPVSLLNSSCSKSFWKLLTVSLLYSSCSKSIWKLLLRIFILGSYSTGVLLTIQKYGIESLGNLHLPPLQNLGVSTPGTYIYPNEMLCMIRLWLILLVENFNPPWRWRGGITGNY